MQIMLQYCYTMIQYYKTLLQNPRIDLIVITITQIGISSLAFQISVASSNDSKQFDCVCNGCIHRVNSICICILYYIIHNMLNFILEFLTNSSLVCLPIIFF